MDDRTIDDLSLRVGYLEQIVQALEVDAETRAFWDVIEGRGPDAPDPKIDNAQEDALPQHEDTKPYVDGGDGIEVTRQGDYATINAQVPEWWARQCDGELAMQAPGAILTREPMVDLVFEGGCFYKIFDRWGIKDGRIYNIEMSCSSSIVCAEACTELVEPTCP